MPHAAISTCYISFCLPRLTFQTRVAICLYIRAAARSKLSKPIDDPQKAILAELIQSCVLPPAAIVLEMLCQMHLTHAADLGQAELVCQPDPVHHVSSVGQLHKEGEGLAVSPSCYGFITVTQQLLGLELVGQHDQSHHVSVCHWAEVQAAIAVAQEEFHVLRGDQKVGFKLDRAFDRCPSVPECSDPNYFFTERRSDLRRPR